VLLQIARALRREAHASGITGGQATILGFVDSNPELGMGDLAACLGVSAPALTRYVDRLVRGGLVTRVRATDDARKITLELTPKGLRTLRSVRSRRTAWLATRLDEIAPEDRDRIEAAIDSLQQLLDQPR